MFKSLMGSGGGSGGPNRSSSSVASTSSSKGGGSRRRKDSSRKSTSSRGDDREEEEGERGLGDLDAYSSPSAGRRKNRASGDEPSLVVEKDRMVIERGSKSGSGSSKSGRRRDRERERERERDDDEFEFEIVRDDDDDDDGNSRRERRRNHQSGDHHLPPLDTNVSSSGPLPGPGGQFAADIAAPGFSQFPQQYDTMVPSSMPEQPASASPTAFDPHVHQQFPGQFPAAVAEPYRPANPAGEAASYYGDQGQSVAEQPGVRPNPPTVIPNSQAHLMPASPVVNPPPEPSSVGQVGAAAAYYDDAGHPPSQTSQPTGRPPKPSKPNKPSSALGSAAAGAAAYGVGSGLQGHSHSGSHSAGPTEASHTAHAGPPSSSGKPPHSHGVGSAVGAGAAAYGIGSALQGHSHSGSHSGSYPEPHSGSYHSPTPNAGPPPSSPGKPPNSHGVGTAVGAAAAGAAAGYMLNHHHSSSSSDRPPQYTMHDHQHPHHGASHSHGSANPALYGAGAAGVAGLGAAAHGMHSHSASHGHGFQSGGLAFQQRHRGPLGKFVDFWRDPEGVGRFEDYTETIGVCKYCFEPGTSSRDAPRRHHYHRRRSWDRHSAGSRVEKLSRFTSSEDEGRRRRESKKKSWLPALLTGYAAKSLFTNKDFDDTYSVKSGRVVSPRDSFNDHESLSTTDRKSQTSRGVYRRGRSPDSYGRRKQSRSRSRSSSRSDRHSALRKAALGAAVGGAAYAATKSRKDKSRKGSSSSSSESSTSDSSRPARKSVAGGLASFFTSPSKNKTKQTSRKSKGIFAFNNSSSSSTDADLAFGSGISRKKAGKARRRSDENVDATLLGLGAAATALAGSSHKHKRTGEALAGKDSRARRAGYASSVTNDEGWEDFDSGDQSPSSVGSGLAFGGGSDESQTSDSGTSGWWGWGGKRDKKRRSSSPKNHHTGAALAAGAIGAGALASAHHSRSKRSSKDNANGTGPLQSVFPVPTSDPSQFDAARDQPTLVRPGAIPLQQPQPVAPVSNALYTTQGIPAYYPAPSESAIGEAYTGYDSRRQWAHRRSDSSPVFGTESMEGVPVPGVKRRSTANYSPSVQFDLTEEQMNRERRSSRRERGKRERDFEGPQLVDREYELSLQDSERQSRRRREREDEKRRRSDDYGDDSSRFYRPRSDTAGRESRQKDGDSSSWVGAATVGTIGAAAAATALSGKSSHEDPSEGSYRRHSERREKRQAERRREGRPEMTSISEHFHDAEDNLAGRSDGKQKISSRDVAYTIPGHDDYAQFFAPEGLRRSQEEHGRDHEPTIVEVEPATERFSREMSRFADGSRPKDGTLPWAVPSLNLIEPTPPQSHSGSVRDVMSPTAGPGDASYERSKQQSSGSRVSWGEHETHEYEVPSGSSEQESDHGREPERRKGGTSGHGISTDVEFAATVAAATAATGFDSSLVTDDPSYHTRSAAGADARGFVEGEIDSDGDGKNKRTDRGAEHSIEGEPIYAEPEGLASDGKFAPSAESGEQPPIFQDGEPSEEVFAVPGGFETDDSPRKTRRDGEYDARSAVSAPADNIGEPADEAADKKKKRKKRSKRDSGDDGASVTSSPAKVEAEESRRSKDDKDKSKGSGGFFSGIFGSRASEPAEPRNSSSTDGREVQSEIGFGTGQEESRRRKKRSSRQRSLDDMEKHEQGAGSDREEKKDDVSIENYKSHRQHREEKRRHRFEDEEVGEDYEKARLDNDDRESFLAARPEMPRVDDGDDHGVSGLATAAVAGAAGLGLGLMEERSATASPGEAGSRPTSPEVSQEQGQEQDTKARRSSLLRMSESPTAIPLHFRRPPTSPSAAVNVNRPPSVSSPAVPSPDTATATPITTPTQPRHRRPTSTEFKNSREIRPLFLVERHGAAKMEAQADADESLPSLPSSKPSSRTPSIEDLKAADEQDVRAWEPVDISQQIHHDRRARPAGLSISTGRAGPDADIQIEQDILDSQQATPTAESFNEVGPTTTAAAVAEHQPAKKDRPSYEFHSPSELLQDPGVYSQTEIELPPSPTLDVLPSAEGSAVGVSDDRGDAQEAEGLERDINLQDLPPLPDSRPSSTDAEAGPTQEEETSKVALDVAKGMGFTGLVGAAVAAAGHGYGKDGQAEAESKDQDDDGINDSVKQLTREIESSAPESDSEAYHSAVSPGTETPRPSSPNQIVGGPGFAGVVEDALSASRGERVVQSGDTVQPAHERGQVGTAENSSTAVEEKRAAIEDLPPAEEPRIEPTPETTENIPIETETPQARIEDQPSVEPTPVSTSSSKKKKKKDKKKKAQSVDLPEPESRSASASIEDDGKTEEAFVDAPETSRGLEVESVQPEEVPATANDETPTEPTSMEPVIEQESAPAPALSESHSKAPEAEPAQPETPVGQTEELATQTPVSSKKAKRDKKKNRKSKNLESEKPEPEPEQHDASGSRDVEPIPSAETEPEQEPLSAVGTEAVVSPDAPKQSELDFSGPLDKGMDGPGKTGDEAVERSEQPPVEGTKEPEAELPSVVGEQKPEQVEPHESSREAEDPNIPVEGTAVEASKHTEEKDAVSATEPHESVPETAEESVSRSQAEQETAIETAPSRPQLEQETAQETPAAEEVTTEPALEPVPQEQGVSATEREPEPGPELAISRKASKKNKKKNKRKEAAETPIEDEQAETKELPAESQPEPVTTAEVPVESEPAKTEKSAGQGVVASQPELVSAETAESKEHTGEGALDQSEPASAEASIETGQDEQAQETPRNQQTQDDPAHEPAEPAEPKPDSLSTDASPDQAQEVSPLDGWDEQPKKKGKKGKKNRKSVEAATVSETQPASGAKPEPEQTDSTENRAMETGERPAGDEMPSAEEKANEEDAAREPEVETEKQPEVDDSAATTPEQPSITEEPPIKPEPTEPQTRAENEAPKEIVEDSAVQAAAEPEIPLTAAQKKKAKKDKKKKRQSVSVDETPAPEPAESARDEVQREGESGGDAGLPGESSPVPDSEMVDTVTKEGSTEAPTEAAGGSSEGTVTGVEDTGLSKEVEATAEESPLEVRMDDVAPAAEPAPSEEPSAEETPAHAEEGREDTAPEPTEETTRSPTTTAADVPTPADEEHKGAAPTDELPATEETEATLSEAANDTTAVTEEPSPGEATSGEDLQNDPTPETGDTTQEPAEEQIDDFQPATTKKSKKDKRKEKKKKLQSQDLDADAEPTSSPAEPPSERVGGDEGDKKEESTPLDPAADVEGDKQGEEVPPQEPAPEEPSEEATPAEPEPPAPEPMEELQTAASKKKAKKDKKKKRQSQDLGSEQASPEKADEVGETPPELAAGDEGDKREEPSLQDPATVDKEDKQEEEAAPAETAQEATPAEPEPPVSKQMEEVQTTSSKKKAKKDKKRKSVSFDLGEPAQPDEAGESARVGDAAPPADETMHEDVSEKAERSASTKEVSAEAETGSEQASVDTSKEEISAVPDEQGDKHITESAPQEEQATFPTESSTEVIDTPMPDTTPEDEVQPLSEEKKDAEGSAEFEKVDTTDTTPKATEQMAESDRQAFSQEDTIKQEPEAEAEPVAAEEPSTAEPESSKDDEEQKPSSSKSKKDKKKKKKQKSVDLDEEAPAPAPEPEPVAGPEEGTDKAVDEPMPDVKEPEETAPAEQEEEELKPFMSAKEKRKAKKEKKRQSKTSGIDDEAQDTTPTPEPPAEDPASGEKGAADDAPQEITASTEAEAPEPSSDTANAPAEEDGKEHQSHDAQTSDQNEQERIWTDEMASSQVEKQQEISAYPQTDSEHVDAEPRRGPGDEGESLERGVSDEEEKATPAPADLGETTENESRVTTTEGAEPKQMKGLEETESKPEAMEGVTSTEELAAQPTTEEPGSEAKEIDSPAALVEVTEPASKSETLAAPEEEDWMASSSSKKKKKKQKQKEKEKERMENEKKLEGGQFGEPTVDNTEPPPGELSAAEEPVAGSEERAVGNGEEAAEDVGELEGTKDPVIPSEERPLESGQENDERVPEVAAEPEPLETPESSKDVASYAEDIDTQVPSRKLSKKEKKKKGRSLAQESASEAQHEEQPAAKDAPAAPEPENAAVPTPSESHQEENAPVPESDDAENQRSEGKVPELDDDAVPQAESTEPAVPTEEVEKSMGVSDPHVPGESVARGQSAEDEGIADAEQTAMDVTQTSTPEPEAEKAARVSEEPEDAWMTTSKKKSKKNKKKALAQGAALETPPQVEEPSATSDPANAGETAEQSTTDVQQDDLPRPSSEVEQENAGDDEWATTTKKKGKKAKKEKQKQKAKAEAEIAESSEVQGEAPPVVGSTDANEPPAFMEDVPAATEAQPAETEQPHQEEPTVEEPTVSLDPFDVPPEENMDVDTPMEPTGKGDAREAPAEGQKDEPETKDQDGEAQEKLQRQALEKEDDLGVAEDLLEDRPKKAEDAAPLSRKLSKKEKKKAKQRALQAGVGPEQQVEPDVPQASGDAAPEMPTEPEVQLQASEEGPAELSKEPEASLQADDEVPMPEQPKESETPPTVNDPEPSAVEPTNDEPPLARSASKKTKKKAQKANQHIEQEQPEQEESRQPVDEQGEQAHAEDVLSQQDEEDWPSIEWAKDEHEGAVEQPPEPAFGAEQDAGEPKKEAVGDFDESAVAWAATKESEQPPVEDWSTGPKKKDRKKRKSKQRAAESSAQPMPVEENSVSVEDSQVQERELAPEPEPAQGAEDTPESRKEEPDVAPPKQSKITNVFPNLERGSFRRTGKTPSPSGEDSAEEETITQDASRDNATQVSEAPIATTEYKDSGERGEPGSEGLQSTTTLLDPFTEQPTTREIDTPDHDSTPSPSARCGLRRSQSIHGKHRHSQKPWSLEDTTVQPTQTSTPPQSLFGGPIGPDSEAVSPPRTPLDTIAEQEPESRVEKAGEGTMAPGSGTPQLEMKPEHLLPQPRTPVRKFTDNALDRKKWPTPDSDREMEGMENMESGSMGGDDELGGIKKRRTDERRMSNRDKELPPTPTLRPSLGGGTGSSSDKGSLRRTTRSVSGDLRATSRAQQQSPSPAPATEDASADPPQPLPLPLPLPSDLNVDHIPSSSAYDPVTDKGKRPARGMTGVYEGWGETPTSPRSPNRPPSVRHRRSMQHLQDMESRLDQLVSENRLLAAAREEAEDKLQNASVARRKSDRALNTRGVDLRDREAEVEQLRGSVDWLQKEVARLTHENEGWTAATAGLTAAQVYQLVGSRDSSTRELDDPRSQYDQMSGDVEDRVRQEVDAAIANKNAEIRRLHEELEATRDKVREMQQQIATTMQDDILVFRDEDYFDGACQRLCGHVQQWVLRFSKHSDHHRCRRIGDLQDEKVADRFDNAILDGSDADAYLSDRVRRRDVFMSVVMTMIWEYVFTRYLFGMDRDQRQKLKSLEKHLGEVGPRSAVHRWRATTLTLLAKRSAFAKQRESDTEAVALEIFGTLARLLPPPTHVESQLLDSLRKVLRVAVNLSIEMRSQLAEYIMLPPLQPEYDTNGDLARHVYFNASLMNERSGETTSNEELESQQSVVRIVLFPLVVKKGNDTGDGEDEIVVCPAQVLVARPFKDKSTSLNANRSVQSIAPPSMMDMSNVV